MKTELLEKSFQVGDFLNSVFHVLLYTSEAELLENADLMALEFVHANSRQPIIS